MEEKSWVVFGALALIAVFGMRTSLSSGPSLTIPLKRPLNDVKTVNLMSRSTNNLVINFQFFDTPHF